MEHVRRTIEEALSQLASELEATRPGTPERALLRGAHDALSALRTLEPPPPATCEAGALKAALDPILGLEIQRRRILERLALLGATGRSSGPAILLAGPRGTGKHALVAAAAAATGRPVARVDVSGATEADLAGVPRAASGVAPGSIAAALIASGSAAPILVLDRVDLAPPSAALETILDPERRATFGDRFLEVALDLGAALVIATVHHPARVPPRLAPYVEEIRFSGYTRAEKAEIARSRLLPRALVDAGAMPAVDLARGAIHLLAECSSEPGVSWLESRLREVVRRAAAALLLGDSAHAVVGADDVRRLTGSDCLPAPRPHPEVGVATGLVWGGRGAEIAVVEALRGVDPELLRPLPCPAAIAAAIAHVSATAERLRIPQALPAREICVRVRGPEPVGDDDGLELAVLLALVSLASDRPVRPDVAIAGALTLRGSVRSVAGLPEKVLAAGRAGARKVIVPLSDFAALRVALSADALAAVEVTPVSTADEAIREALIDIVIARELSL